MHHRVKGAGDSSRRSPKVPRKQRLSYKKSGVDTQSASSALDTVFESLKKTWRKGSGAELALGHFANVVDLGLVKVAISTDGVGSKAMIAELMGSYEAVGSDCVAVNVNDLLCVGARPTTLVDYLAVRCIDEHMISQIGEGLRKGAEEASVSVVGGETAQLPDLLQGEDGGNAFDLAGTAIGVVGGSGIITGEAIQPGDVIMGLSSSGLHCNGFTLARRAFGLGREVPHEEKLEILGQSFPHLDGSLGDELLKPARIYVAEVMAMLQGSVELRGVVHVTQDGFLNLPRLEADVGYAIDELPEPPAIFDLIQKQAVVPDAEMYEVFNMGIGLCIVVPEADANRAIQITLQQDSEVYQIGRIVDDPERTVTLTSLGLRGWRDRGFEKIP